MVKYDKIHRISCCILNFLWVPVPWSRDFWLPTTMASFSRALGTVLRRAQRSHGALVPLGARSSHLNALAAAGIVLGSSLVTCKEKKPKVEVKDWSWESWKVGLMQNPGR